MNWKKFSINFVSVFLLSFLLSRFYCYSKLSIKSLGDWTTFKYQAQNFLNGTNNFYHDRKPLRDNRLNLNEYYSHDGIISLINERWNKVEFEFELKEKDYFLFYLEFDHKSMVLRLSADKNRVSKQILLNYDGEFLATKDLELTLEKDIIYNIKIVSENAKYFILLDGKKYELDLFEGKIAKRIAFKSNHSDIYIDNIFVDFENLSFFENFENTKDLERVFIIIFITLLIIFLLYELLAYKYKFNQLYFLMYAFVFCISMSVLYSYDYFIWSKYVHIAEGPKKNVEKLRRKFFFELINLDGNNVYNKQAVLFKFNLAQLQNCRITSMDYPLPLYEYHKAYCGDISNKETKKILFLGSSQTVGAGAFNYKLGLPFLFANELFTKTKRALIVYNLSESGSNAKGRLKALKSHDGFFGELDVVFINLGFNDNYSENYIRDIGNLITYIKKNFNALIIYLNEPHFSRDDSYLRSQRVTSLISSTNQIRYFDYLKDNDKRFVSYDDAIYWWDDVHLTQFAQKLYAQYLVKKYLED
tara:strand:- start:76285 stop:77874 length:1590 start_codon:yes stop_codon:yes gene_type:complete